MALVLEDEHLVRHARWEIVEGATWPFERATFFEDMMKGKRDLTARLRP